MGGVNVEGGEQRQRLRRWRRPGVLGLRLTFGAEQRRAALSNGFADWIWDDAERNGIPIIEEL